MTAPIVASTVTSTTGTTSSTNRTVTTTGLGNGDLGLAFIFSDGNQTMTWPSPWVELADQNISTVAHIAIGYVFATTSISSVVVTSSLSERSNHIFLEITGQHATQAPEISAGASGASTTPNPDSLNPAGWDVEDTLWIATAGDDSAPSGLTYPLADNNVPSPTTASAGYGAVCSVASAVASLDPGTFGWGVSDNWQAYTIAVRPVAAGGGSTTSLTASDTLTFSDSVSRLGTFLRTCGDAIDYANTVLRNGTWIRTPSDNLTLGDAVTRLGAFLRTAGDNLSLGNVVAGIKVLPRSLADTLGISDASGGATPAQVQFKSGTNQISAQSITLDSAPTQGNLLVAGLTRRRFGSVTPGTGWNLITDGIELNPTASQESALLYKVVPASDPAAQSIGTWSGTPAEGRITIAEFSGLSSTPLDQTDLSKIHLQASAISQTMGTNATAAGIAVALWHDVNSKTFTGSDTIIDQGLCDTGISPTGMMMWKSVSAGSFTMTGIANGGGDEWGGALATFLAGGGSGGGVTRILNLIRSPSDTLTLGNTVARVLSLLRSNADTLTLGNAVTRAVTNLRTTADSLGFGDTVARVLSLIRTAADSVTFGNAVDAQRSSNTVQRTAGDSLGLADAVTRTVSLIRTAADTLSLSAVVAGVIQTAVTIGNAVIDFLERMSASLSFVRSRNASLSRTAIHEAALVTEALEYDLNDQTDPTVTFTVDDVETDPTTVSLTVRDPDGTTTTYTYGGGTVTKSSTGVYTKSITLNKRGVWTFTFAGTGACQATAEGTVTVRY